MNTPRLWWLDDLRRMVVMLAIVWALAWGVLALMVPLMLGSPDDADRQQLLMYIGGFGSATVLLAYAAYRLGLIYRLRRLRYILLFTTALTILLFFANVFSTARLMFISEHDYGVTVILLIFAAGTALGFGGFIANALTERISQVAEGARKLSQGDLTVQVPVKGNDELAELATTFNSMVSRLAAADSERRALEQTRRDLIAWVSHDLRTPLSALRLLMSALNDDVVEDAATRQRYARTALREIDNLSQLINDLFELAQMDAGRIELLKEATPLSDLLSDTLSSLMPVAAEAGVQLSGEVQPGIGLVKLDPQKIGRVLTNLISNSVRHTPAGGMVKVEARRSANGIEILVRDNGEGIPAADLPHIFDRFYRGEPARMRDKDGQRGAGLGLAIVRGLVEAHGGQIKVESQPGQGSTFSIVVPGT
ncbi:MAG: HAMP domain-containing histidine kinase [Anaerolineae bacterium]|nr:HAMP domain-containing histidine kinase [Anaerolineae bacterium]